MALRAHRVLSLFSGGGGLDLALGIAVPDARTVCFVEGDIQAAELLAARMEAGDLDPAPIWSDVRTFDGRPWSGRVDCIVGGFPCQDISLAGSGAGIEGERSGLWGEYARIIREVGPRLVFVENVAALTSRGLDRVLGDLADLGFDAEWVCLRAFDVGAPHIRNRMFILGWKVSDPICRQVWAEQGRVESERAGEAEPGHDCSALADPNSRGLQVLRGGGLLDGERETHRDDTDGSRGPRNSCWPPGPEDAEGWAAYQGPQPSVRRDADGMAHFLDRLRILGNGVVPVQGAVALLHLLERACAEASND